MVRMCITKNEILELNDIIQHLNAFNDENEREKYLKCAVEDVDLFLSTLKKINKSKLATSKKKKTVYKKRHNYTTEAVMKIFEENDLDDIVAEYSKQELTDMYLTFYTSKPLSSYDKKRIAQNVYHYIHTMERTKALLE